jgi:hypothetical protein
LPFSKNCRLPCRRLPHPTTANTPCIHQQRGGNISLPHKSTFLVLFYKKNQTFFMEIIVLNCSLEHMDFELKK